MRIAVLADIHGNLPALEAALADVSRLAVDQVVIAGDVVVGSPDSLLCWERVKSLGCPVLRGNHERYVFDLDTPRAKPEWKTEQFGPVQFAARQMGPERCAELAALPATLKLPDAAEILFVHASPRNDSDLVFPYTPEAELETQFAGATERWLVRGHNHYAGLRLLGERRVVTVGSVGLPLDGTPSAQYTLFEKRSGEWTFSHRSVPYDIESAVRRFSESGYLGTAGPMARLYQREVLTASFHIVPFLKFYSAERVREPELALDSAVSRFCPAAFS